MLLCCCCREVDARPERACSPTGLESSDNLRLGASCPLPGAFWLVACSLMVDLEDVEWRNSPSGAGPEEGNLSSEACNLDLPLDDALVSSERLAVGFTGAISFGPSCFFCKLLEESLSVLSSPALPLGLTWLATLVSLAFTTDSLPAAPFFTSFFFFVFFSMKGSWSSVEE